MRSLPAKLLFSAGVRTRIWSGTDRTPFLKDFCEGCAAAGVAPYDLCAAANLVQGAAYHFVGYSVGEQYQQVGTANLLVQAGAHLSKYLCLAFVVLADFLVLADHPVMASDNDNTHEITSLFVSNS